MWKCNIDVRVCRVLYESLNAKTHLIIFDPPIFKGGNRHAACHYRQAEQYVPICMKFRNACKVAAPNRPFP